MDKNGYITEKVNIPQGNDVYYALMSVVWQGIDMEVFKYPLRGKSSF